MKEHLSHFCLHVKDMDKAVAFYKDIMGFEVEYQTPEWSELKLNDKINLALQQSDEPGSGIGYQTANCEEATNKLEEKGVKIISRCQERNNGNIILTQFEDVDGNVIWISQKVK